MSDRGETLKALGLPLSLLSTLGKAGFHTFEDVAAATEGELLRVPGFGRKHLKDVKEALADRGLEVAASPTRKSAWLVWDGGQVSAVFRSELGALRWVVAHGGTPEERRLREAADQANEVLGE